MTRTRWPSSPHAGLSLIWSTWLAVSSLPALAGCGARSSLDVDPLGFEHDVIAADDSEPRDARGPAAPITDPVEPRGITTPLIAPEPMPAAPLPATDPFVPGAEPSPNVPVPTPQPLAPPSDPSTPPVASSFPDPLAPNVAMPGFDPASCDTPADGSYDAWDFEGVTGIFFVGDDVSTGCTNFAPGQACVYGTVADAGPEYTNWGTMLGLLLGTNDNNDVFVPFDASAYGIIAVSFRLAGNGDATVRAGLSSFVNETGDTSPEAQVQYTFEELSLDGSYTIPLDYFSLPPWTQAVDAPSSPDTTRLHSLQLQVVSRPGATLPYSWCLTELQWLDALGTPVAVPPLMTR